jgi:hypothetical protein
MHTAYIKHGYSRRTMRTAESTGRFPSFQLPEPLMEMIFMKSRFLNRIERFEKVFRRSMSKWRFTTNYVSKKCGFSVTSYLPCRFFPWFRENRASISKMSFPPSVNIIYTVKMRGKLECIMLLLPNGHKEADNWMS